MRFFSDNYDYYSTLRRHEERFALDEVNRRQECTKGFLFPREGKIVIGEEIKGADDTGGSPLPLDPPRKIDE